MIFVILAFILMFTIYRLYISTTMRSLFSRNAIELLNQTKIKINAELIGHETTLILISNTIRSMIMQGYSADKIQEYMEGVTGELENSRAVGGAAYNGLYGYFEVFGGKFIHAPDWDLPENYNPVDRPWYKIAVEAGDKAAASPVFMNSRVNDYAIAYVRRIFDKEGRTLGVVCLDIPLKSVTNFVADMRLNHKKGSYGIFGDENLTIFYHPDSELIGTNAREIGSGFSILVNEILSGHDIFEQEVMNHKGENIVFFSTQLENGWFLWSSTPRNEYYRELNELELTLFIIGTVMAIALVTVLIYFDRVKKIMDDENRKKTIQLAVMEKKREADNLTQLMLDATPLSCTLWDNDINIMSCNWEAVKMFKCSDKQECLDRFYDLSPEYQPDGRLSRDMLLEYCRNALIIGYSRFEYIHQTLYGDPIPVEIMLVRIKHKENFILAGYARDLREHNAILNEMRKVENELRVARDAAEAASFAKTAFLANMSHEIRTPMNSIMGFLELAMDGEVPAKTRDYLNKIQINADWLLQIINNILDISKIESGKMELENIPFDMHELFTSCRTLIMPKAVEKGIQLYFYAEPSIGRRPLGDPTRLRQVLVNLLSNAIKFTNTGMVKLQSAITNMSKENITIYFEVRDSGIGMTQAQIKKIFDPFMQAETGTTRKYGGTGLGLTITKNIVEMMGGTLSVESAPGVGSKFSFVLTFNTVDIADDNVPGNKIVFNELEKPLFEGEILLCEDNAMNQQVIREHLARIGLKTVVAENGKIGVDAVKNRQRKGEKQFDLIFMDMLMPVMDGLEAAEKIIQLNAGIPIVAMTANIMSNDRDIYKMSGMNDCVGKPFTSQELWRCLMKYFTPLNRETVQINTQMEAVNLQEADLEFKKSLQKMFVKNNQKKYEEIVKALDAGDIKLAHRMVHTLKGNAGQLGKTILQKAAADVEHYLKDGANLVTEEKLKILQAELEFVLNELSLLESETVSQTVSQTDLSQTGEGPALDTELARELIKELEPMLKMGNPECQKFLDGLRKIPGSETLIQHIENFDFESAIDTLAELKKKLEIT